MRDSASLRGPVYSYPGVSLPFSRSLLPSFVHSHSFSLSFAPGSIAPCNIEIATNERSSCATGREAGRKIPNRYLSAPASSRSQSTGHPFPSNNGPVDSRAKNPRSHSFNKTIVCTAGAQRFPAHPDERRRGVLRHPHHRELPRLPSGTQ